MRANTQGTSSASADHSPASPIAQRYRSVRTATETLCAPLSAEDCVLQSMPDVSPTKWHLAHTTWFFETFVLERSVPDYRPIDPLYRYLFNSYYNTIGERHPRPERGLISRPSLDAVYAYRRQVDSRIGQLLDTTRIPPDVRSVVELGLHHEQQHQELILTDIKHVFSCHPSPPAHTPQSPSPRFREASPPLGWIGFPGGLEWIGHEGGSFHFDNEAPRHRVYLEPFELASRPVTNGEFRRFVEDRGYQRPELWLSDGWETSQQHDWQAPLYWKQRDGAWWNLTLGGMVPLDDAEPVCHVSYYESDAYARWANARLPTEAEWEVASFDVAVDGNFVERGWLHPVAAAKRFTGLAQMFGDVWEWTASPYTAYPKFRPAAGALGEYNGKFMCNQFVLRGGSCATPRSHLRRTYRNFFPPTARWQFSGLRLARDP